MKLYFTKGACSLAVRILINELGVECEYESVNLKTKRTEEDQDYLQINPKGAVPALELEDGQILTENAVVQQYLADKFNNRELLAPVGDFKRYRILECMNFITTELHKNFSNLFNSTIPQEMKEKVYIPLIKTKLGFIDKQLKYPYLMGEQFTLPDAYMFVMLMWAKNYKIDLTRWDHLPRYFATLQKRPAIIKSLEEETLEIA
ncbi:glutathione transferase GstA [Legionella jamestowniensis]|uniref:Glutathione S-transferase n=1 Tax=Legionella jamestowniensis TaxID=455 RepID=A0A0W0UHM5_9GAMM|nr:glutathione transferase GstA [Legionella jamestowniensis]KTD07142.1 glutathione S-transferase [Legionella jamestowniensis]OCH98907.1 glutathione transferase GstA [Legionella jamestowniensis]SFL71528.1 glutathione S-transferase [Legionella jamestowniensis DSM 19215]